MGTSGALAAVCGASSGVATAGLFLRVPCRVFERAFSGFYVGVFSGAFLPVLRPMLRRCPPEVPAASASGRGAAGGGGGERLKFPSQPVWRGEVKFSSRGLWYGGFYLRYFLPKHLVSLLWGVLAFCVQRVFYVTVLDRFSTHVLRYVLRVL